MKALKPRLNNWKHIVASLLIASLLIPTWLLAERATAFSSNEEEVLKSLAVLQSSISKLPTELFAVSVKDDLKEQVAEVIKNFRDGQHCRSVKLIEDFLGGIRKLRGGRRTPLAEDLHNQGWGVRQDMLGLVEKGDPCETTPRFNQLPAVQIIEADNQHLIGRVTFGEPKMWSVRANGELFTEIRLPGIEANMGQAGLPGVPVLNKLVAVPQGAKAEISVRPGQARSFKLNLYPFQPEAADQGKDGEEQPPKFENPPFTKDEDAYRQNANFPAELAEVSPAGKARDLQMARLSIAAGQYNPVTEVLTLFDSVDFEIVFQGGKGAFVSKAALNPFESSSSTYLGAVINAHVVPRYVIDDLRIIRCIGAEYLILTHPDFRAAADRLADWKRTKGITTSVINVNDGAGSGPDTKEQIDALIETRFNQCLIRPSYVLLLGDAEFIPTFYRDTYGSDTTGTDYPYALLSTDGDDAPDFALGRIPVDTLAQADIVVDKIINYEQHPPALNSFYQNIGVASQFQCCRTDVVQEGRDQRWFIETTEFVRDHLLGEGYTAPRIYTRTTDGDYEGDDTPRRYYDGTLLPVPLRASSGFAWPGDTNDIVDAWNAGRFLFYHRDHGWKHGWGNPSFESANVVNDLNNGNLLPVVFSVNCASGLFDNETNGGDYDTLVNNTYFVEHVLRKADGGAVGMLGDTRNSPTGPNNVLTKGFFDAVWPDLLGDFGDGTRKRRLGDILNHGKLYLKATYGLPALTANAAIDDSASASELYLWHAFGDPTLEMWTAKPRRWLAVDFNYKLLASAVHVKYPLDGAVISAIQEFKGSDIPVARGVIKDGEAILQFVQKPVSGVPIEFSASLENEVSMRLGK